MTADTLDIDALHAALDADPEDQFTRRVLADACNDAGDLAMADGLRWMADTIMRPVDVPAGWAWTRQREYASQRDWDLHPLIYDAILAAETWCSGGVRRKTFGTRQEAEEALCRSRSQEPAR